MRTVREGDSQSGAAALAPSEIGKVVNDYHDKSPYLGVACYLFAAALISRKSCCILFSARIRIRQPTANHPIRSRTPNAWVSRPRSWVLPKVLIFFPENIQILGFSMNREIQNYF